LEQVAIQPICTKKNIHCLASGSEIV